MKKNKLFSMVLLLAFTSLIVSFVSPAGGEGYEIYIDNKLVMQQFGQQMKQVKNVQLNPAQSKGDLKVKFYHCGMAGKSRTLELKSPDQKVLKQWQFANEEGKNFAISVPVKEIVKLQEKSGAGTLHLFYASKEVPQGRFLAGIIITDNASAKR